MATNDKIIDDIKIIYWQENEILISSSDKNKKIVVEVGGNGQLLIKAVDEVVAGQKKLLNIKNVN